MNIRYPIYEGVYRILTIVCNQNIYSILENKNVCLPHILAILLFYQGYR